jgi:ABC-type transport system involved in multi-copper enzyme maturation permease subunit
MPGLRTIIRKELKCLLGSDKSTFLIHALMPVIWSLALYVNSGIGTDAGGAGFWFVFFAVIVTANFSNTVFISERVNGTLEILITSGLSRDAVLFGKMAFVIAMTLVIGLVCVGLAGVWGVALFLSGAGGETGGGLLSIQGYDAGLYASAAFFCASASAYLSVRMPNPRFLHFINLFMMGAVVAVYSAISAVFAVHSSLLILTFLLMGAIFTLLARREFAGERIVRPIIF